MSSSHFLITENSLAFSRDNKFPLTDFHVKSEIECVMKCTSCPCCIASLHLLSQLKDLNLQNCTIMVNGVCVALF